jgi:glucoamylase
VILGSIYFSVDDGFLGPNDPWVLATARKLEDTFANLYNINKGSPMPPAIGRYPEDVYTGSGFGEGNPWFLATNAFAEFYCRLSTQLSPGPVARGYKAQGMGFLDRSIYHSDPKGRMPEQFNRNNGFTQGAADLTWSYTSYVRAYRSCATDTQLVDNFELSDAH